MPEISKMPSVEEITEMYRKIEQNEKEIKRFEADLKKLISGDKKLASSPLLVGNTPASLAICGADGTLDMTITKKVIDKIMSPEIRDSSGQRLKKSGHFLSESQLVNALENLKNPVMVLKGSKDNSLVAITDIQDDKGQQILVSVNLSDSGSVEDVNRITSAYGREGFADYMKQQINKHKILAYNKEKANELLLSIGVDFPEANTIISFDNSIAYTTANVKYPSQVSEQEQTQNKTLADKDEYKINNPVLASQVEKRQMKIAKLEDKNTILSNKAEKNKTRIEKQHAKIDDDQKTKAYCKTLLESAALPKPLQVFFQSMMDRQDNKIARCAEKVESLTEKNNNLSAKIAANNGKITKHKSKIERLQKVDRFLTNMQSRDGRKENFVQAITDFRNNSLDRYNTKLLKLDNKISAAEFALTKATAAIEKIKLRNKIVKLNERRSSVGEKIQKLTAMTDKLNKLTALPEQRADEVVTFAAENIKNAIEPNNNVNTIVDTVLNEADNSMQLDASLVQCYSIEQNGITRFFQADNLTTEDIIKAANSEKPFIALSEMGRQITEESYAAIQQSDKFGNGIEINFDENTFQSYIVNNGKGGIADHDRDETNTVIISSSLSDLNIGTELPDKNTHVSELCSYIQDVFEKNYNGETHILSTTAVFNELAQNSDLKDVKSVIATAILDCHSDDGKISAQAQKWAKIQPLSEQVQQYREEKGSLPLNIKTGFLDVFAKKIGTWEQNRQEQTVNKGVFKREDITGSASKIHKQKPSPEHATEIQKNDPSL